MRRRCADELPETPIRELSCATDAAQPIADALPAINVLEAGLVPLREFPLRKWYFANPLWYYHAPALHHRLNSDPAFFALLDPLLRELCQIVLAAGLCTTPSCQGHFYPRRRFEAIWRELLREQEEIRNGGLIVQDSETNEALRFRAGDYRVPWPSFEDFFAAADGHQHQGYIGIAAPVQLGAVSQRLAEDGFTSGAARIVPDADLSRILGQPIFGVHVDPRTPEERDAAWIAVTSYLRAALADTGARPPAPSEPQSSA